MDSRKEIARNNDDVRRRLSVIPDENEAIPEDIDLKKWPIQTYAILLVEGCERFTFYGMRSVLTLYLSTYLGLMTDEAAQMYHVFCTFLYLTPIIGAIISDSYWGRFQTIWRLSIVYVLGLLMMMVSSIPILFMSDASRNTHYAIALLGLFLIGCGAGGIKPCVSPFGADQFHANATKAKESYFRWFYLLINIGALVGGYVTPMLRNNYDLYPDVSKNDKSIQAMYANVTDTTKKTSNFPQAFDQAHLLAFGLPTVLFLLALVVFFLPEMCRKSFGKYVKLEPDRDSENIAFVFFRVIARGKAKNKYERDSCRQVLKLFLLIFMPLSVFWSIADQSGTYWTYAACQGDGQVQIFGYTIHFICDQLEVINPFMIMILIPAFNYIISPALEKLIYGKFNRDISRKPLDYMFIGLCIGTIAQIFAWQFDARLSAGLPSFDTNKRNQLSVPVQMVTADASLIEKLEAENPNLKFDPETKKTTLMDFSETEIKYNDQLVDLIKWKDTEKTVPDNEQPLKFIAVNDNGQLIIKHVSFALAKQYQIEIYDERDGFSMTIINSLNPDEMTVLEKKYPKSEEAFKIFYKDENLSQIKDGARFIVPKSGATLQVHEYRTRSVSGLIPQYFFLTLSEVFISITALEFAFTQAPVKMRTLCTGFWYTTVAVGNVFVIMISGLKVSRSDKQLYFVYGIAVATLVFFFTSKYYEVLSVDDVVMKFEDPEAHTELKEKEDQDSVESKELMADVQTLGNDSSTQILITSRKGEAEV